MKLMKPIADGWVTLVLGSVLLILAVWAAFQVDHATNFLEYPSLFWTFGGMGGFLLILGALLSRGDDHLHRRPKAIIVKTSLVMLGVLVVLSIALVSGQWVKFFQILGAIS